MGNKEGKTILFLRALKDRQLDFESLHRSTIVAMGMLAKSRSENWLTEELNPIGPLAFEDFVLIYDSIDANHAISVELADRFIERGSEVIVIAPNGLQSRDYPTSVLVVRWPTDALYIVASRMEYKVAFS